MHAQKTLARHALDMRSMSLLNDKLEFRRIQAELRACGASTGYGAMHILNNRLTDGVSQTLANRRSSEKKEPIVKNQRSPSMFFGVQF
jgi:hypothetical protein